MPKYYFTALSPFFIREHPYITSAKGLGEWVVIIVIYARLRQAAGKSDAVVGFIHLQSLGSSQLADHLVNEINQGPCYVKWTFFLTFSSIFILT